MTERPVEGSIAIEENVAARIRISGVPMMASTVESATGSSRGVTPAARCSATTAALASSAASTMSCGTSTKIRLPIQAA
ncbi:hypothetical protein SAMN05216483_2247 [Streptomyces sp. 2131.1]|nr:hypothetical protein SAMN05216483_2247 [Streptomyces sp. 2131.1]